MQTREIPHSDGEAECGGSLLRREAEQDECRNHDQSDASRVCGEEARNKTNEEDEKRLV